MPISISPIRMHYIGMIKYYYVGLRSNTESYRPIRIATNDIRGESGVQSVNVWPGHNVCFGSGKGDVFYL